MNWLTEIDRITSAFEKEFGELDAAALNWKPDRDTWSIAQNIDHLVVVNETYFPVLQAVKTGSYQLPFLAKIGFMVSFFGKTVLNAVQPDRRKKMKTFTIWEPSTSDIAGDILARFKKHQTELKAQISASEGLIKKGTIISSPANKHIVYKLETAFDIMVTHEERHLEQAKEVLALLKNQAIIA
ncbi:MAG: DinB family protein [Saprospiraceae bacterium]|nr:DinB family protein [Saprospiraceae bacterium]